MRIYKYPVSPLFLSGDSCHYITAPRNAAPLSIEVQSGGPVLYMIVNPGEAECDHRILCVGTGHSFQILPTMKFIGTAVLEEGTLVLHYFYCGKR